MYLMSLETFFSHINMYKNVIDLGKSVSFVLEDIDIGRQIQYLTCTGSWIKEFLTNRKFRVIANGCMSEEGDVMSGVPQGTVLAAILFVIMISDIDEKVKNSFIQSFADDTRVNKKVICNE